MAKQTIDFVLIDESVVMHGFRVLTAGAMLDDFKKNPVMLFMHNRADFAPGTTDVMLPIGKWYDIRVQDGRLMAKPDFDDSDDFAKQIESKVVGGYLNAASIWIDPVQVSDDPFLKLAGQPGVTVTKWGLFEGSIVDIPNCRNALAVRNSAGKKIILGTDDSADSEVLEYLQTFLNTNRNMEKKLLAEKLGLDENASDNIISKKLSAVLADAGKLSAAIAENDELKNKLVELNQAAADAKVNTLVDGAIAAHKLAAGERERYVKLAKADFETTAEIISDMKPYKSIEQQMSSQSEAGAAELAGLAKLNGKDLWKEGKLDRLKELDMNTFKLKYKEAFGVEYKG